MTVHGRGGNIARIPKGSVILGGLEAAEDVIVDGRLDGHITVPEHHVTIGASAVISARIIAHSVTIAGAVDGNILARERLDILATASVRGHLTTPSLTVQDGAKFNGTVDPHRTEAALQVARYRQRRPLNAGGG